MQVDLCKAFFPCVSPGSSLSISSLRSVISWGFAFWKSWLRLERSAFLFHWESVTYVLWLGDTPQYLSLLQNGPQVAGWVPGLHYWWLANLGLKYCTVIHRMSPGRNNRLNHCCPQGFCFSFKFIKFTSLKERGINKAWERPAMCVTTFKNTQKSIVESGKGSRQEVILSWVFPLLVEALWLEAEP